MGGLKMQAKVEKIRKEIKQTKTHLAHLETYLKKMQENCYHEFKEAPLYQECIYCLKVEAFHY